MGKLLSKFRKEKSTIQILEDLDEKIKNIAAFTVSTQARQKRLIGNFLVISIGFYVIAFIIFYFVFFPPTWNERIVYSTPMLLFPILIFLIKRMVAWYFQRKVNKNSSELRELRAEKKKILEEVQEKETYKVALEILKKFSDSPLSFNTSLQLKQHNIETTPRAPQQPMQSRTPQPTPRQRFQATPNHAASVPNLQQLRSPAAIAKAQFMQQQQPYGFNRSFQPTPPPMHRRTPYPIINQNDKGVLEKMVDYLIGDGPGNRFAMICKTCSRHNGMALQEDYEYATFICAFCGTMNPAKKQRPVAPRLLIDSTVSTNSMSNSTSDEEKDSGDDDDTDNSDSKVQVENVQPTSNEQTETTHDQEEEEKKESEAVEQPETLETEQLEKLETEKKDD